MSRKKKYWHMLLANNISFPLSTVWWNHILNFSNSRGNKQCCNTHGNHIASFLHFINCEHLERCLWRVIKTTDKFAGCKMQMQKPGLWYGAKDEKKLCWSWHWTLWTLRNLESMSQPFDVLKSPLVLMENVFYCY